MTRSKPDMGGAYKTISKKAYFEKIGYVPHAKQWLFHNSEARFRVPVCGRRFGKSKMAGADIQPSLLYPGRRSWIVGPTYDLGEKEFRVVWDDMIIKLGFGRDKRVKKAYNKKQGTMFIEFPWQTRIEVRSADHPENLVGESLHRVIMSEAAKHKQDTFERYIRAALADYRGVADFPTTPEGQNWLYKMWQQGQDPADPDSASWQFPSWENPHVFPLGRKDPEILRVERTTTNEWFLQEYAADFTAFVGKIYGSFQESVHVRPHTFNPLWRNYIAFDWGYTNPMAAVEFQVSPMDTVHVWRMWYQSYMTVGEFLRMIKNTPNPPGYHLDLCFGDAADPGATREVTEQFHPCISDPRAKSGVDDGKGKSGIQSGWRQGVDLVNQYLKVREADDLTEMTESTDVKRGLPGLFVDNSCKDLISEFNNYKAPETRGAKNTREAAMPFADHALDALRYGMMHVFKIGAVYHLDDMFVGARAGETYTNSAGWSRSEDSGLFTMNSMEF